MSFQVRTSPRSKSTSKSVYNFITNKFGAKAANEFILKAKKTIRLIAEYPYMFKASGIDENVRIGFITKQTSLVYSVSDDTVYLLYFWDNRQEPILPQL